MQKETKPDLSFAYHINSILGGKDFRKIKDGYSHKSLRQVFQKVAKSIRFAVEENLSIIDSEHMRHLAYCIDRAEDRMRSTTSEKELFEVFTSFQGEMIFLLLGDMPKHREGFVNRRENWKLNGYRSIIYTQDEEQKNRQLDSYIQNYLIGENKIFEDHTEYFLFRNSNELRNRNAFLNWLKKEHFEEYEKWMELA